MNVIIKRYIQLNTIQPNGIDMNDYIKAAKFSIKLLWKKLNCFDI